MMPIAPGERISKQASVESVHPENGPVLKWQGPAVPETASDDEKEKAEEVLPQDDNKEDFPDGGYGWVIVGCSFAIAMVTWGLNATFGIFLSFYLDNDYYPGATPLDFAFIGGLSLSLAMLTGPFSNWLSKSYGHRVPMIIGTALLGGGQIAAGWAEKLWQLFLTQGVCFGLGLGFIMVSSAPIVAQWFGRKRSLALGLQGAGSGAGGLAFSSLTRLVIERHGLRYAFLMNGLCAVGVLIPATILMKSRNKPLKVKFHPFQLDLFKNGGFVSICLWGFFIQMAYATGIYSIPTYATQGLGLTQKQGATLQSMLAAGQLVGRPICGIFSDKIGRINGASIVTIIAGFSCFFLWMFASNFAILGVFAIIQGATGGIFWISNGAVLTEIIGIRNLSSGLSMLWLTIVIPATISAPLAQIFATYSQDQLGRTGTSVFHIGIGFTGAMFTMAGLSLLGAKRFKQGNWKVVQRT